LSSLEEEHGGYVCHPRAPSGNNSRTHSFITPTTRKTEVLESPSLKLLRKKKRKVDSLGITLSSLVLLVR
jgi:hypothetical protein